MVRLNKTRVSYFFIRQLSPNVEKVSQEIVLWTLSFWGLSLEIWYSHMDSWLDEYRKKQAESSCVT